MNDFGETTRMIEKNLPVIALYLPTANALPGLEPRHLDRLHGEFPGANWVYCADDAEFLRILPSARAVVVWRFRAEWLEKAWRLSLVSTPSAGHDWIEVAPRAGLAVEFSTFHGEIIAETVVGFALAFARGIKDCLDRQWRRETWPRGEVSRNMRTLRGGRVSIVGFGHVGKWIGRLLKPFGVRVTGVNRCDLTRPEYFEAGDRVVTLEELDSVLSETDHLVLALPGNAGTDRVICAARLALLPPDACVYNVGRGNAIDMPALVQALEKGALRGAGIDVFPEEPLPANAPIRNCPNVILMPHTSAFAPNYIDLYLNELLPQVRMHVPEAATGKRCNETI